MASNHNELGHQIRNIATLIVGIFDDKKMTIDEQVDLGIERLNEASIALIRLRREKRARNELEKDSEIKPNDKFGF